MYDNASLCTGPTVVRLVLDGPVRPLVTDTVRVAEAVRHAAMSRFERWCRRQPTPVAGPFRRADRPDRFASPVLAGKGPDGSVRATHGHAHFLPAAEGDDPRRLTHVTVWAADRLGPGEVAALAGLGRLTVGAAAYRVRLVGLGRPGDFTARLLGRSAVWESVTPFVAHRHLKRRGAKRDPPSLIGADPRSAFAALALRELAARELVGRRGLARLVAVEPMSESVGGVRAVEFRRSRDRVGDDGWRRACGLFRLRFAAEVAGPLSLGYASHYGLGLFRPV
jgi:CRISPR-associated protein Csb2